MPSSLSPLEHPLHFFLFKTLCISFFSNPSVSPSFQSPLYLLLFKTLCISFFSKPSVNLLCNTFYFSYSNHPLLLPPITLFPSYTHHLVSKTIILLLLLFLCP
jgi:hypothetical protein